MKRKVYSICFSWVKQIWGNGSSRGMQWVLATLMHFFKSNRFFFALNPNCFNTHKITKSALQSVLQIRKSFFLVDSHFRPTLNTFEMWLNVIYCIIVMHFCLKFPQNKFCNKERSNLLYIKLSLWSKLLSHSKICKLVGLKALM